MPQQFVRQENSTPDFSQLAQNLAQNVAYRRQKQDAKAQQRAQLQLAMDNGLIPGAEMEVGDNGIAFPSDAAQAAYQDALSTWGKEDLSRKGGVNTTTELVNDPMGQTAVLSAQARQGNTNPAVQKINQDILNTDVQSMRQNIRQSVDEQLKNVTSQNAASQQNSADITSTMANYLAQNIAPQLSGKGPLLPSAQGQTTPTDPQAQPPVPQPNSRIGAQTKVENKVQQMGVIEEHARQKGAKIDVKPMFQTTTEHQENFTDSIKRSLPSMAGLAMLESVNNMFGGPSNPVKQSAFQQLYEQRAADYKRFDEAMSKNGRSVGLSGGEVSVDEGESDSSLKNTDREYVSSKNDVNVKSGNSSTGGGGGPKETGFDIQTGKLKQRQEGYIDGVLRRKYGIPVILDGSSSIMSNPEFKNAKDHEGRLAAIKSVFNAHLGAQYGDEVKVTTDPKTKSRFPAIFTESGQMIGQYRWENNAWQLLPMEGMDQSRLNTYTSGLSGSSTGAWSPSSVAPNK